MLAKAEIKKHDLKPNGIKTNGKKEKSIQDIWDEDLADPNSPRLKKLIEMGNKAATDYKAGKCTPGGFGY
jgi:hypothetical protein